MHQILCLQLGNVGTFFFCLGEHRNQGKGVKKEQLQQFVFVLRTLSFWSLGMQGVDPDEQE